MMLGIFGTSLTLDRQDPQSELPLFESAYFEALDYTSQTQLDLTAVVENLLHGRNPHFRQFQLYIKINIDIDIDIVFSWWWCIIITSSPTAILAHRTISPESFWMNYNLTQIC